MANHEQERQVGDVVVLDMREKTPPKELTKEAAENLRIQKKIEGLLREYQELQAQMEEMEGSERRTSAIYSGANSPEDAVNSGLSAELQDLRIKRDSEVIEMVQTLGGPLKGQTWYDHLVQSETPAINLTRVKDVALEIGEGKNFTVTFRWNSDTLSTRHEIAIIWNANKKTYEAQFRGGLPAAPKKAPEPKEEGLLDRISAWVDESMDYYTGTPKTEGKDK